MRRIKLDPEMRTARTTIDCDCGFQITTRSPNEAVEAWAEHQRYAHPPTTHYAPAPETAAAGRSAS